MSFDVVSTVLIIANVLISLRGFKDHVFFDQWMFKVDRILQHREYYRVLSSGFVHTSGSHLAFNMISFYFFAGSIERSLGSIGLLVVYFGSLIVGGLFSLLIHYNNASYRAVGASGAVSGVVFAAIALFPGMKLALLFLPIPFPAWAFGLGFVAYSIYGIRSQADNIGHEAHLGGAVAGLLISLMFDPQAFFSNTYTILLIFIPTAIFMIIAFKKPEWLFGKQKGNVVNRDDDYHQRQVLIKAEMDRILEKISIEGLDSLTASERDFLNKFR